MVEDNYDKVCWQQLLKKKNVCRSFRGIGGVRPAAVLVVS